MGFRAERDGEFATRRASIIHGLHQRHHRFYDYRVRRRNRLSNDMDAIEI